MRDPINAASLPSRRYPPPPPAARLCDERGRSSSGSTSRTSLNAQPDLFMQMALQLALGARRAAAASAGRAARRPLPPLWEGGDRDRNPGPLHADGAPGALPAPWADGRTIRTLSTASVEWVKAMENVHVDVDDKWEALKAALLAHGMQLMRVLRGEGIDRHLMGLYVAAVMGGGELPPVFTDHAFKKSGMGGNSAYATSNVGYTPQFGGFAPMTPDGYGAYCAARGADQHRRLGVALVRPHRLRQVRALDRGRAPLRWPLSSPPTPTGRRRSSERFGLGLLCGVVLNFIFSPGTAPSTKARCGELRRIAPATRSLRPRARHRPREATVRIGPARGEERRSADSALPPP